MTIEYNPVYVSKHVRRDRVSIIHTKCEVTKKNLKQVERFFLQGKLPWEK